MWTIWKFPLEPLADVVIVDMPRDARVISCAEQHGTVCVWAAVDSDAPMERRGFHVVGTGHPIPERYGARVGMVVAADGNLIWHIWETLPRVWPAPSE